MTSMAQSFNYSFRLPEGVIADEEPQAELDQGVLKLTFKKAQKKAPKKVNVAVKSKAAKAAK